MKRLACAALASLVTLTAGPRLADACGGCFHVPAENTVVTGHRMVVSISPEQSVLWDQIQYSGNPSEFSWVLPVKPGARIEVASDAFFDVLEAATSISVSAPPEGCAFGTSNDSGFGCGSADFATADEGGTGGLAAPRAGVDVISEGSVGPYDTVTLSAEDPQALKTWLADNGFVMPDEIGPTVDAYVQEGFDFIALKLSPDQGIQQMTPVRVVSPGGSVTLPLRMVAAGTGAQTDIVLYVIGEGRYQARDYDNAAIPPQLVTWDFRSDATDYGELRLEALGANDGRTWLTSYARRGSLLGTISDDQGQVGYTIGGDGFGFGGAFADTIIDAFFLQGDARGQARPDDDGTFNIAECVGRTLDLASSMGVVTDLCDENGENCLSPAGDEIDARDLTCGKLDDIAVAMLGLHPADVVLTRMEASLPQSALSADLVLEAAPEQREIAHRFTAGLKANACWDSEPASAIPTAGEPPRLPPGLLYPFLFGSLGVLLASRRRRSEPARA